MSSTKFQSSFRIYLVIIIVFSFFFKSYSNAFLPLPQNLNWQLETTVNGVEFYYAISKCNTESVVFLKMKNKNNYNVQVSWQEVFQTQLEKNKETGTEKKVTILPGETFESDCANISHPELVIFSSQINPTYVVSISKFNYKNIKISKAN
ncbi:hypothetical protein DC498_24730 [Terrimonas sp.]|uniref:hypothetical protein n=1 Tax=Terrimonas sp. TaxID=1914338 RepID=UPI000D51E865|nr:hypothetical protein [Terrimonas sp.]PVD49476.1 hypothetical protein DC498_24730 [Terrimonas sp.]